MIEGKYRLELDKIPIRMSYFSKKSRQSEVKELLKNLRKTGENRHRTVVREQGRVITFEDGKDLGFFELIRKNTLNK